MHFRLFPAFSLTVKTLSWMPRKANYCNYIVFTKMSWPGDSEETFRSSSQTVTCFSPKVSHCPFYCWTSCRKAVNYNLYTSFSFHPTGNWNRVYRFSSERFIHSPTDRLMLHFLRTSRPIVQRSCFFDQTQCCLWFRGTPSSRCKRFCGFNE